MKVQLLTLAIVGVAVVSAMTSSASAMEVPFWYETDVLTGEVYYVDHFNDGKKTWVTATPEPPQVPLPLQGIGNVIQTHSVIDSNDVDNAEELTSQEIKNIKIKNEADRTYDLLATLYPGLYPVVERDVTTNITQISQQITEKITPIPEPIIVIPEPVVVPEPIIVVPIPEPVPIVPEVVVPIPEPVPIVPEVVVPPEPVITPNVTGSSGAPSDTVPNKQDMTSEDWDQFLQDVIPADRPLQSIEDFFD